MIYGYARVSTRFQKLEDQVAELERAGAGQIFKERESGARTDRRQLRRLLRLIEEDDTLIVTRLDRLARSTRDLLNILDQVNQAGAQFRSLHDGWADTTTPHGRLMLTMLGGLAEFERELIRARTSEGRARAKARGQRLGGPSFALTPHQRQEVIERRARGEPVKQLARSYNVSERTIFRLVSDSELLAVEAR
jgi:DNA invertase Pin-like site-specific DNA recombinase